jgi:transcriptional regulator with XRE-family HTH domain
MNTRPIEGDPVQRKLGELFLAARKANGINLKELAQRMGRSINTVRWHENGARSLRADDLVMAARIMGCSATSLVPVMSEILEIEALYGKDKE